MVRFVLGPDSTVVPDLEQKLPGRGAWLTASAEAFAQAERRNPFPRAFRGDARLPDGLAVLVTDLLLKRCMNLLGLANGAGQVTAGYEKVRDASDKGPCGAMIVAADGGDTAQSRARKMAWEAPVIAQFGREELSLALGRENVVHAAVAPGRLAENFVRDAERLRLLMGLPDASEVEKRT
jgi:predicted RNA-binding protein YlxR (DUF448 family)